MRPYYTCFVALVIDKEVKAFIEKDIVQTGWNQKYSILQ